MTGHDSQGGGGDESKNQTPLVDVSHNVNILQIDGITGNSWYHQNLN